MIKNIFKLKNFYILIALAGLAYGGFYFGTQNTDTTSNNKTLELTTVAIKKGDLEKKEEYNGTLRQTDKKVLNSPTSGVVTYLPKEGTIINFGEVLFIIDNKPVILLEGSTPFYRTLDLNSDPGKDIKQVEEALVYLGYAESSFVPDEIFDTETSGLPDGNNISVLSTSNWPYVLQLAYIIYDTITNKILEYKDFTNKVLKISYGKKKHYIVKIN